MVWLIRVTEAEQKAGELSPASFQKAREALDQYGCLVLRGVFPTNFIDQIRMEYEAQWGRFDAAAMEQHAKLAPPQPVLKVGVNRYETLVTLKGALAEPRLLSNAVLCRFLVSVLDETIKLSGVTVVTSFPGAEDQHVHSDHPNLFKGEDISASLPHYAINVAVPLIDVNTEMGTTGLFPGSHRWPADRKPNPEDLVATEFLRGDCVLIDYRTRHMGLANRTKTVRPILYMVYARTWFFDESNHVSRPSLDLPIEVLAALPAGLRPLLMRAYSNYIRTRYFSTRRNDSVKESVKDAVNDDAKDDVKAA